ncbi:MAG: hypothetical protein JOY71_28055 [Acetobacteraceae bacterium]|nr:hypothetical protein [Acetobacteraceae bacterium]
MDGIEQKPIEVFVFSRGYTFDNPDAPTTHKTQYFEMMGVPGSYNDGWILSAVPIRPPGQLLGTAITDHASAFKLELHIRNN